MVISQGISQAPTPKQWAKTGDEAFEARDFFGAALYYKKAFSIDSTFLLYGYKYAESLRKYNEYVKAENTYQYIFDRDKGNQFPYAQFWLAIMQKNNQKYELARKNFTTFRRKHPNKSDYEARKAKQEIKSCEFAKRLILDTVDTKIENMGSNLNTTHSEFSPVLINDSTMYFSSIRTESEAGNFIINEGEDYQVKIYESRKRGGFWENIGELDTIINKPKFHNGNGCYSLDSNRFYFSRCAENFKCEIYVSEKANGVWKKAEPIKGDINIANYTSTQPHIGNVNGEEILFFVSDRPRGRGKLDIWYSKISNGGKKLSKSRKLNNKINSIDNELSPYYDSKSKTLYFSSTWHYGLGGFDIQKTTGSLKTFTTPHNIGYPYNTSTNDFYYVPATENTEGFLVSNRKGGYTIKGETCCNDIYTLSPIPPVDTTKPPITEEEKKVISLENLNKYLPITLYFHNDEPNPRTRDTITKKDYITTYNEYIQLIPKYQEEYAKGLTGEDSLKARKDIEDFFLDYVDKGVEDLELFLELLIEELEKGQQVALAVKGYASPLAKSDYNVNLTLRRISSLINTFSHHENGVYKPYLQKKVKDGSYLDFVKIPFGEYKSDNTVSDNLNDQKNSVYSRKAALERKIEILSVHQVEKDSSYSKMSFSEEIFDFGFVKPGKKLTHVFKFENTGQKDLQIIDIESSCGCTAPYWKKEPIKPGEKSEIKVTFDTTDKIGKQVKTVTVLTNGNPDKKVLTITAEIDRE